MALFPALTVLILAPEYFLPVRMLGADYHATLDGKEAGEAINQVIERGKAAERHQTEAYASVADQAGMLNETVSGPVSLRGCAWYLTGINMEGIRWQSQHLFIRFS